MFLRFSDVVCKYSHFSRKYNIFHFDRPIYQLTTVIPGEAGESPAGTSET